MSEEINISVINESIEIKLEEEVGRNPCYIDPFADFAFKRIFSSESSKDILKNFLNEIMSGYKHIETIEYRKNEYPGEIRDEGGAILDVVCTDQDGGTFLIEVQSGKQEYFKERALFYTSRLISEQAPKGDRRGWAYNLKEVYLVALLEDFNLADSNEGECLHNICLINRMTGKIFYNKLGFTYIEILNFVKTEAELETRLDKWLYALKNLKVLKSQPISFTEPEFEQLFNLAKYTNLTQEEREMYNASMKARWDNQNVRDYAKKESRKEGLEEGRKEGREKGIEEGREKGIEEGKEKGIEIGEQKKAVMIAIKLKAKGIPVDEIIELTDLSIEEIESL